MDREPDKQAIEDFDHVITKLAEWIPLEGRVFRFSPEAQTERATVTTVAHSVMLLPDTSSSFKGHLGEMGWTIPEAGARFPHDRGR